MNSSNWSQRNWWSAADIAAALGKSRDTIYHHLRVARKHARAEPLPSRFPLEPADAAKLAEFIAKKSRAKK